MASNQTTPGSGLFVVTKNEPKERLEEELESCGNYIRQLVAPQRPDQQARSNQEMHDILSSNANANSENHEKVCLGLFYVILTDVQAAPRAFQDLTLITRDHFGSILAKLNIIIIEKYLRLLDVARQQLLWLVQQLVSSRCIGANQCCICLMKNIIGGDVSTKNVWLAERVLEIFMENETVIFENDSLLLAHFIFTYLRLICDHRGTRHESLRKTEIKFCVSLLRQRFMDCFLIGRDLVRLLLNVARIPEFQQLWRDILFQPQLLSPKFNGILSLMQVRSQRKFIAARLTMEMENKLNFLMSKVKFGNQKRYQEWFQKSYLSTAESQNLCPDLIRYICCVIHPTNEILSSDIIPRWAVIGWLLLQCKSNSIAAECKLALFFDWLTFQMDRDNIMNIEPAVLVMYHNLKHHPATSITLLDFLCRIQTDFYPPLQHILKQGVHNSFRLLLEKRVLPSLAPIFESNKLDPELKSLVKTNFGDFMEVALPGPGVVSLPPPPPPSDPSKVTEALLEDIVPQVNTCSYDSGVDSGAEGGNSSLGNVKSTEPIFSSEEEDIDEIKPPPLIVDDEEETVKVAQSVSKKSNGSSQRKLSLKSAMVSKPDQSAVSYSSELDLRTKSTEELIVYPIVETLEKEDISKYYSQLESDILENVMKLNDDNLMERDEKNAFELVKKISKVQLTYQASSREASVPLAACLCNILIPNLAVPVFNIPPNRDPSEVSLAQLIKRPLYAVFEVLCKSEADTLPLSHVVAEMYELNPRVGYHLLLYLSVYSRMEAEDEGSGSSSLAHPTEPKDVYVDVMLNALDEEISVALVKDMHLAAKHDMQLFIALLPFIFNNFPQEVRGNVPMARLIVSSIDPGQLNKIISLVMLDEVEIFDEETISDILADSLKWESFEQMFLWQLIGAHELSSESVVPVIHKINWKDDAEAATALMLRLKKEKPTIDVLKHLYSRYTSHNQQAKETPEDVDDQLCTSLLYYWSITCASQLAEMTKRLINGTSNSSKASQSKSTSQFHCRNPTLTEILRHLDKLRLNVDYKNDSFFSQDAITDGLKFAHTHIYKSQKEDFQDLFGLINVGSPSSPQSKRLSNRHQSNASSPSSTGSASTARTKRNKRESSIDISTDSESNDDHGNRTGSSKSSSSAPKKKARRTAGRVTPTTSKRKRKRVSNEKTESTTSEESDSSN